MCQQSKYCLIMPTNRLPCFAECCMFDAAHMYPHDAAESDATDVWRYRVKPRTDFKQHRE